MKRLRLWIANKLAGWARRIYPQSEEVMSFYVDRMTELAITGQSCVKISTVDRPWKVEEGNAYPPDLVIRNVVGYHNPEP